MKYITLVLLVLVVSSCATPRQFKKLKTHEYAKPVDTESKEIAYQETGTYLIAGVGATNNFPAARLNKSDRINDSLYEATIMPENAPINPSPWYAFKIWAKEARTLNVRLEYGKFRHRYNPKISSDGEHWETLDSTLVQLGVDSTSATIKLNIDKVDLLYLSGHKVKSVLAV